MSSAQHWVFKVAGIKRWRKIVSLHVRICERWRKVCAQCKVGGKASEEKFKPYLIYVNI